MFLKSKSASWNPKVRVEIEKCELKSKSASWTPKVRVEHQKCELWVTSCKLQKSNSQLVTRNSQLALLMSTRTLNVQKQLATRTSIVYSHFKCSTRNSQLVIRNSHFSNPLLVEHGVFFFCLPTFFLWCLQYHEKLQFHYKPFIMSVDESIFWKIWWRQWMS